MIEGDAVVHELIVPAPPEEVFEMFVDPQLLVRWIGISADLEPRPGGRFRFEIVPGEFCEGAYTVVDRPHRVAFTWGWTTPSMGLPPGHSQVEVTFEPSDGGQRTRLRLVHTGLGPAGPMHDDGWTNFLDRLVMAAAA